MGGSSLCVYDFSGRDGWKKLEIDVRPTFHLVSGYPLSKHKTQLTNESGGQAQRSKAVFKGVMMYEGACSYRCCDRALSLFLPSIVTCCLGFRVCRELDG